MTLQKHKSIRFFDKFVLLIPPKLKYRTDGIIESRSLFITDPSESFLITFEEGMKLMDMLPEAKVEPSVCFQCFKDGKYIHLRRKSDGKVSCAFFHIELEDENGNPVYLPGQMVASSGYNWSDGIEPVLMELLAGISLNNELDSCD